MGRWGFDERAQKHDGDEENGGSGGAGGGGEKGALREPIPIKVTTTTATLIQPPRGVRNRRARRPVAFVVEKGAGGLR